MIPTFQHDFYLDRSEYLTPLEMPGLLLFKKIHKISRQGIINIGGSRNFKRGVPNQLNGCGHKYYIKLWVWFVMFIGKMDAKPTEL